jgi:pyridoxamine 5'-phosphate oxidase
MDLADLRKNYSQRGLLESDLLADPISQFRVWFDQALAAGLEEPNAMTLATCTPDGVPSARIVLLKGLDETGFAFYTSYDGRKAKELAANPRAALVFYWAELERQVRVEGSVERTSAAESDAYFESRPRGSRFGAWTSEQSRVVEGRAVLEARMAAIEAKYAEGPVPRPPFWGGFRVRPEVVEFWQGRPSRMHDRLRYRRDGGAWVIERLSP